MLIAHRIALDSNNVQATYLARAAGVACFAYNWALSEWQRQYVARQADPTLPAPSQLALRRPFLAARTDGMPALPSTRPKYPRHQPKTKVGWASISSVA